MGGFVLLFLLLNLNPGEEGAAGRLQEMSGQAAGPRHYTTLHYTTIHYTTLVSHSDCSSLH